MSGAERLAPPKSIFVWRVLVNKRYSGYIVAVVVIAAATGALKTLGGHINPTTVALALLLIVVFVATAWGPKPAILSSLLGVACFNFFFLPPLHTFVIADPENWVALLTFLITAVTVGQLSAHAKRRAEEADSARTEVERLYGELQESFEQASQAQALKQSERLKSALLDAVTHDLRTPLTAIKASVTTLISDHQIQPDREPGKLGAEGQQEMLEVIDEEADRLDRFIEGMMELARIEAGELHLKRRDVSLEEILQSAVRRAAPRTRLHRVQIQPLTNLPTLSVDEAALVEVFYVLLDNAAKYSPPGTLIQISAAVGSDEEVLVSVTDEGRGITPDLRHRVFDKFFRATGDAADQPSGTGMGLAIAQGIVEAHGGRVFIEDGANGVGVKMVVSLPTTPSTASLSATTRS
jgi:two-component system sensor histidine kinase KdpD